MPYINEFVSKESNVMGCLDAWLTVAVSKPGVNLDGRVERSISAYVVNLIR